MADVVNVGTLPNDGTGTPERDAFIAINAALAAAAKHAADKANPHGVTAKQVGAYATGEVDDRIRAATQSLSLAIASAITALGLGTAATLNAGTATGNVPVLDGTARLPIGLFPDALLGAVRYQGGWNAATNTPALPTPAPANKGFYYIVMIAGTTSLPGPSGPITDWQIGDWAVSDGAYWEKVDSSDLVTSVAGLQGVITAPQLNTALGTARIARRAALIFG